MVGAAYRGDYCSFHPWVLVWVEQATGREVMGVVEIPMTFRFLQPGWLVLHLIGIPLVFYLGHLFWPG